MGENIKVRWLVDNEQTKVAPKTFSTQILNEDGTYFKDTIEASITEVDEKIITHSDNSEIHVTAEEKEGYATKEYVENLYKKLNSNTVLGFYCVEDVTIVTNGVSKIYPANSNVEIAFIEDDVFEIIPTSDNSILSLSAFPNALGTFYSWLEGVAQFSNILFDMNDEAMYSKWSQGNQGVYHVQSAQYTNCIFWSDNPYISDVSKRTNYTLTHTSQLPLCYSTIPDNTFKSFYLAGGVNSDPNWSNQAYKDSFAKANWATQVFSYYGARTVGLPGMFDIVLPKDCRGLMFDARNIENAGTFDATNTTNFGANSGSWREAFGDCTSLRRLYIKNLKVSLNISWSPIDYNSISYIISAAANTSAITISVSPYTYNLLSQSDFELAASKNITIALLTTNYVEDRRLSVINNKADRTYVDENFARIENIPNNIVQTVNNIEPDENGNVEIEIPEGFSGSWNDLKDKPFGEIEKVILDATFTIDRKGSAYYPEEPFDLTAEHISTVIFDGVEYENMHGAEFGNLWYFGGPDNGMPFAVSGYYGGEIFADVGDHTIKIIQEYPLVTKTIDEKYIPDTIARVENIPNNIVQTVNNIEPDENGNVEIEIPEGFSGSWNDLKDKPFYVNYNVMFDFPADPTISFYHQELPSVWTKTQTNMAAWTCTAKCEDVGLSDIIGNLSGLIGCTIHMSDETTYIITEDNIFDDEYFMYGTTINGMKITSDGTVEIYLEGNPNGGMLTTFVDTISSSVEVKYIDDIVIPDTIARIEDISWNNLEDKPFYVNYQNVEILPETVVNISDGWNSNEVSIPDLIVGEKYIVVWDGIEYECIANGYDDGYHEIGCLFDNSEGYIWDKPFVIGENYSVGDYGYIGANTEGDHTVQIVGQAELVHHLDEKFIPDTIARVENISWNDLKDKPFYNNFDLIFEPPIDSAISIYDQEVPDVWTKEEYSENEWRYTARCEDVGLSYFAEDLSRLIGCVIYNNNGTEHIITEDDIYYDDDNETRYFEHSIFDENSPGGARSYLVMGIYADGTITLYPYFNGYSGHILHSIDVIGRGGIKHIDDVVIPDTIARKSDIPSGLPAVTSEDVGKFLRVSSEGVWVAEVIPNAEEASF